MARILCPVWMGYVLLNPLRRLVEDPQKFLGDLVKQGMLVVEAGCGMGYFTLPLARMVGNSGRVIAIDLQEGMLQALRKRAHKRGLGDRIETRLTGEGPLPLADLEGKVDLVVAIHVIHEVNDQDNFLRDLARALKAGGIFLFAEPRGHVKEHEFKATLAILLSLGLDRVERRKHLTSHSAVLKKLGE